MTLSLTLPADIEAQVFAEAAKQDIGIEEYVVKLISSSVSRPDESARRQRAIAAIESLSLIGSEEEQRETFEYLAASLDNDRLSDRKLFQ
ncbi:MAG TPA: hypothetical protein VGK19_08890 [Capsulimonadaceae bacterium]|jgi:hypothetical protein